MPGASCTSSPSPSAIVSSARERLTFVLFGSNVVASAWIAVMRSLIIRRSGDGILNSYERSRFVLSSSAIWSS